MSAVCIIVPIVVAGWPALSAAIVAASATLGYTILGGTDEQIVETTKSKKVELEIKNSEVVTDNLKREQNISVYRDGVTVTFYRDARGKVGICVQGEGYCDEKLRQIGEELSRRVVQQYVYQKIKDELTARQMMLVEESVDKENNIRLKVRLWEG